MKLGVQVLPEFTVVQHQVDEQVLYAQKLILGVVWFERIMELDYAIEFEDRRTFLTRIIPFFEKHQLKTRKRVDFAKFRKVLLLMEKGEHLKPDGLEKIRQLKATMNSTTFLR